MMPLLKSRHWKLSNGEDWETFLVSWIDQTGVPRDQPFDNWSDALAFFCELAVAIRRSTAARRASVTIKEDA
jgi:hypothetical protein